MSDERLPIEVLNPAQMTSVEGRVENPTSVLFSTYGLAVVLTR